MQGQLPQSLYVTGFAKTIPNHKIILLLNIRTLKYVLSSNNKDIDDRIILLLN